MINIFFALLNFGIVIAVFIYVALRYARPLVTSKITAQKKMFDTLHNEHRQLLFTQKQVEQETVDQEGTCANLFAKINEWKRSVELLRAQNDSERQYAIKQADEKLSLQSRNHALRTAYERVGPEVRVLLEKELRAHFAREDAGHAYIDRVLKRLNV